LLIDLEQLPHRDNRVTLSSDTDRLGVPRVTLHWRWRDEDEANRVRILRAVALEFERAGLGKVRQVARGPVDPNTHHHMGTTRMHDDPAQGVVDADLRVHGEENLYVVGSSVFPTAGCANPTLTALALAFRLGDRLAPPDPSRVSLGRA
jgi:choline dehydrogenase-like flavoprotein